MQPFIFHTPTRISFGEDTTSGIAEILTELGGARPFLVTDATLRKTGILDRALNVLTEYGIKDTVVFDRVPPDSDLDSVRAACDLARSSGCDSVIAIGGGSVMDTAKVANIGLTFEGDVLDYEGMNTLTTKLRPFIAIPTTAGTGSEVSAVAMIKDTHNHKKLLFGSRFLFPDVAILDPTLLLTLPPHLTAATGLDALTHAIESFITPFSGSVCEALSLEAMAIIFASLPNAVKNGSDVESRSATLVASSMAGVSFTNSGVGIVHALAHSVGAKFGTHHGMTNAIFLPCGMKFNNDVASERFQSAYAYIKAATTRLKSIPAEWFSADERSAAASESFIQAVQHLISAVNLPTRLRDLKVPALSDQDLDQLANMALTDPAMMFNPKEASLEDLVLIIKGAY